MILNNAPQNAAIVSNVGEIGEFRIRNSAKAFGILSSGLYANKVRAIIRELSCNAYDSHVAANKKDVPFDVHLPNMLEPYFSIRDYGVGLNHDQVANIYTTYFESTKTDSNDFVGALGLGSKSPFSYTDNFTVIAIKDGRKGIYTAFINEVGVPSIALMIEEESDDPTGIEVKFSVNDRHDFDKFRQEARNVYKHFATRPVIKGNSEFKFEDAEYESKDIVPGVHYYKRSSTSFAIMGNIAYPIQIPVADTSLGDLRNLLTCGLELHFEIGELDFQASREGLSYVPETVNAIKRKLEKLNAKLYHTIASEAGAIPNLWDRATYLYGKKDYSLWSSAVMRYVKDTKLPTFAGYGFTRLSTFKFKVSDLEKDWNIQLRVLTRSMGSKTISNVKPTIAYADNHAKDANGNYITWSEWPISVDSTSHFVINDLKVGATERARYHYRENNLHHTRTVYVIEKVDKTKDMDLDAFFAAIHEPPVERRFAASTLSQRERQTLGKNISILKLERRGGSGYRRSDDDMVWRDAGKVDSFDTAITYYYVPLSGFTMLSTKGYTSGTEMYRDVKELQGLFNANIYGVRKTDIEEIMKRPNWKNFETHISEELSKRDVSKLLNSLVLGSLYNSEILSLENREILTGISDDSPYAKFVSKFINIEKFRGDHFRIRRLFKRFAPNTNLSPDSLTEKYNAELAKLNERYPLLTTLSYRASKTAIADYINLIDARPLK